MRRAFIGSLCFLILAGATYCGAVTGCGGSSDGGGGGGGGGGGDGTTRNVTGTIASSASANLASVTKAAATDDCSGVTSVVVVASDGTSVTDDTLESCAFTLELTIGTAYIFEFRNPNKKSKSFASGLTVEPSSAILYPSATQQFTASIDGVVTTDVTWRIMNGDTDGVLKTSAGSKFTIEDGSDEIPLGTITISNGSANFNSDVVCNNPGNAKYILCEDWTDTTPDELTGYGSIDANGLYTTPSESPENNHIGIIATSSSESSLVGSSDVFIADQVTFGDAIDLVALLGLENGYSATVSLSLYEASIHLYGFATSDSGVQFIRSDDGGVSFDGSFVYTSSGFKEQYVSSSVGQNGSINVVWVHYNKSGGSTTSTDIYFSKSVDGGASFSAPIAVYANGEYNWNPDVAVDSAGTIYVTWQFDNSDSSIVIAKSVDGGASFSSPTAVGSYLGDGNPQIAIDSGGRVYVVWFSMLASWYGNLYIVGSDDGGNSFGSSVRVNDIENSVYAVNWGHDIAVDNNGRVFVAWGDVRNYLPQTGDREDLYVGTSTDYGASFGASVKVSLTHNYNQYPGIVVDSDGNPYVCWRQSNVPSTTTGTMFARSVDGISWTQEISVNSVSTSANNSACDIAVDSSGKVYILFRTSEPVPGSLYINISN